MSGNPLDKRRDTRTSASSSIAGCGWTEIQHNLCYVDDEGQLLPAAGARYRLQVPHGANIHGVLDSNGYASHDGVGFGTVLYDIEPDIDDEKQLILKEIKQAMDEFIAVERQESEKIKAKMQDMSAPEQDREHAKAMGRGTKNAVVGAFDAAVDLSISVGKEALHLLGYFNPLTSPQSYARDVARVKQAKKELQAIADADWKLYATLINDDETQKLFKQFAKEYLDAQHSLEVTEGTTEVITVILGVVAVKAAATISATGTGSSKLAQLGEKLADPIKQLIDVLKRAQTKKKVKGDGNQRIESEVAIKHNRTLLDEKKAAEKPAKQTKQENEQVKSPKIMGDIPEHTYRGDSRSPDEIFNKGFEPRSKGSDTSLEDYARNNSPSNYVGTSKDPDIAKNFADEEGYVYTIKPDAGIDVNKELGNRSPFPHEQEVVIPGGIKTKNIKGATPINKDGSLGNTTTLNPNHYEKFNK